MKKKQKLQQTRLELYIKKDLSTASTPSTPKAITPLKETKRRRGNGKNKTLATIPKKARKEEQKIDTHDWMDSFFSEGAVENDVQLQNIALNKEKMCTVPDRLSLPVPRGYEELMLGFNNVSSHLDNFNQFEQEILSCPEVVFLGIIFKDHSTNLRLVHDLDNSSCPPIEAVRAFTFLQQDSGSILMMDSKVLCSVPLRDRWKFIINFLESKNTIKICYSVQTLSVPLLSLQKKINYNSIYDIGLSRPVSSSSVKNLEQILQIYDHKLEALDKFFRREDSLLLSDMKLCQILWSKLRDDLSMDELASLTLEKINQTS